MKSRPLFGMTRTLAHTLWLLAITAAPAQPVVEAWVQRYSHPLGSEDHAQKVVADSAGNVIVAGYTDDGITGQDFLIIKYSGAGVPLWTNRYNGPGNGSDSANALAVDGNGDVLVAGYAFVSGTDYHYATIKYSGAGLPLWTNLYSGSVNGDEEAHAIAVDRSDNVFVTGESSGDYATVAYSGAGVPLWTNRYTSSGEDIATAMAVDGHGDVFVTGYSWGGSSLDYLTIKYSGSGVPLWINRYNGPGNSSDSAHAVAVDESGNVFVTGESFGSDSDSDYATIKYSGAGVPLWTNRYNGPANGGDAAKALAVDGSGNAFVTGVSFGSGTSWDYATLAYSSAGVPLWTNRYNGPANNADEPTAIALDGSGTVFVTGYSVGTNAYPYKYDYATLAYSGTGVPLWTNRYDGPGEGEDSAFALAVDESGNVLVTGSSDGASSRDFATIAYSNNGGPLWTNRYNWPGNRSDAATAMAVDSSGTVFVTGVSDGGGYNSDYATVAYSGTGVPLWTNRCSGLENSGAFARALTVDSSGNVFVTGRTDTYPNDDYATVAYSRAGVPLWTNLYSGPGYRSDEATAIAVNGNGNVFVTGYSQGDVFPYPNSYATVAYSAAGVPLWTNRYSGPASGSVAHAMAVDRNGNVFVTGRSIGSGSDYDYATVAYSGSGVPLWTNRYNGPANGVDEANAVAVDRSGNVFVTGYSAGVGSADDYATVAYSGAGVPLWTNRYNGPGNGVDAASALAVDGNGDLFVTGQSIGSGSHFDYVTIKYSGEGVPLWTNRYNAPGNGPDYPVAMAVDGSGNVFVTGNSYDSNGLNSDYATVAYSAAGVLLWTHRYHGSGNGSDQASAVAVDDNGNVFVTGGSSNGNFLDYATIKYSAAPLFPIPLNYQIVGNQLVLSWTNAAFTLQTAPAVQGAYTNIPGATTSHSAPFPEGQRYFRLKGNY